MPTYTTELDLLKAVTSGAGNSDTLKVDTSGSAVPAGVATSAKQDTGNTSLASIDSKITAVNTGAVVVSSSALPTGAANQTKQDTGNTSLASVDTKLSSQATATKQDTGNTSLSSLDGKIRVNSTASGSISADNSAVTISCAGLGTIVVDVTGSWSGSINCEATLDGSNWFTTWGTDSYALQGSLIGPVSSNSQYKFDVSGYTSFRTRVHPALTGTAVNFMSGSPESNIITGIHDIVFVSANSTTVLPLPTGASTETTLAALNAKVVSVNTRSDTFTSTTNGTTITCTTVPPKYYALSVKQTGSVTSWDVRLEGSLDNSTFTQLVQHTNVSGTGVTVWQSSGQPCLYIRARAVGLVLGAGTNVIATIVGVP